MNMPIEFTAAGYLRWRSIYWYWYSHDRQIALIYYISNERALYTWIVVVYMYTPVSARAYKLYHMDSKSQKPKVSKNHSNWRRISWLALSPGPLPAFQCFRLKSGMGWYAKSRTWCHNHVIHEGKRSLCEATRFLSLQILKGMFVCKLSSS